MPSRRRLLHAALIATAACRLPAARAAGAPAPLSFDLHAHPGAFFAADGADAASREAVGRTVAAMNAAGLGGAFFSVVPDAPLLDPGPDGMRIRGTFAPGEGAAEYARQVGVLGALLDVLPVQRARSVADLDAARLAGRVAAFVACEGGEAVEADAGRIDVLHADGVRSLQLVHYAPNALGDLQTHAPQHGGLSAAGKAVVRRMNAARMLVDVAHASYETVRDVASLTDAPVVLSHGILQREPGRPIAARAVSAEHARLVAGTGGVIGAWPSGFSTDFADFVENTLRLVDAVGIDHVGLGTDMDANFRPVLDTYAQLTGWAAALAARGLRADEVGRLLGGNARRVLAAAIG